MKKIKLQPKMNSWSRILSLGLAAAFSLTSLRAESFPMPGDLAFDPKPEDRGSPTNKVLTYGTDPRGTKVPLKTLRLTNNTTQTVFPIMRDPNSNILASNPNVGLYDPFDAPNKEYRGYIGYKGDDGKFYFGLQPGQSITLSIPLVFWNGARIGIGTDGEFLTPKTNPNPLRYHAEAKKSITAALKAPDSIDNGVVMWYRAEVAEAPNDDTEDQLAEWTIRDHGYLKGINTKALTNEEIPDNQLVTLINYDVSNVDNLYLPISMQALDVWVVPQSSGAGAFANRDGWKPGSNPEPYGWTGAINDIEFIQSRIRAFTENPNKLLGEYFEGKGWPFYNMPTSGDPNQPIKIPSGANIFAQSPLKAVPSSYGGTGRWQDEKYMLSSGGTGAINVTIGYSGKTDQKGSTTLRLNSIEPKEKMSFIEPGFTVTANPAAGKPNSIAPGTTVKSVNREAWTVELSKPLIAPNDGSSFTFTRPTGDYAAEAMIRLWYSWAQYYLLHWKDKNPSAPTAAAQIKGSMDLRTATIQFNEPRPELVEGMAVKGPGLDKAMTEKDIHQSNAVILEIASDKKSVIVSQVANEASTNATFTFLPPQEILWTPKNPGDPGYPLFGDKMRFGNEPKWHDPYEFAQSVYLVMASMNQIGVPNNDSLTKFMQDVIGANMGFIFDQAAKDSDDGQMVIAMIRDRIKSVLRGVSDFTKYPDILDANGNHIAWYPDPAEPRGGQKFNVFNLDPFVWFVHVKLGFSGYGFSVDDDTADVGAGGANHLQISVTGTGGLKTEDQWTIQAPFGPLRNVSADYSGPDKGSTLFYTIKNIENTTPIKVISDGQHRLKNGDTVIVEEVQGNTAANGTFKVGHATKYSFELYDLQTGKPVASKGTYKPQPTSGKFSTPPRPFIKTGNDLTKVFWRVTGDDALGTFLGTRVKVENVATKEEQELRIWNLGSQEGGQLILNEKIKKADGTDLPAGTYNFTFFGE